MWSCCRPVRTTVAKFHINGIRMQHRLNVIQGSWDPCGSRPNVEHGKPSPRIGSGYEGLSCIGKNGGLTHAIMATFHNQPAKSSLSRTMSLATDPAAGASPADLELGSSYGVMLLSTIIVAALYGFTVLQTLYYYEQFPKDSLLLKLSVAGVWLLDTLTVIFNAHAVYFYLIDNYANPPALQKEIWSAQVELLVTYTVVLIVQLFFIFRIYHLRPHLWYIPAFLGVTAFASFCMVVAIFITVIHDETWAATARPEVTRPLTANWALGNLVDIGITVVLVWYLWTEKLGVRHKTNVMLNSIIVFLVNRGAIAAVVQILTLLTKFVWPQTLVWLAFHNTLSKVYANSMLATLNARVALRKIVMDSQLDRSRGATTDAVAESKVPSFGTAAGRQMQMRNGQHRISTLQFAHNESTVASDEYYGSKGIRTGMSSNAFETRSATSTVAYDARSAKSVGGYETPQRGYATTPSRGYDTRGQDAHGAGSQVSTSAYDSRSAVSRAGTATMDITDYQRPPTGMTMYTARTAMPTTPSQGPWRTAVSPRSSIIESPASGTGLR
ncbi:hypothetical protein C8Q74DRAFT_1448763 [Fomes fomentarius]|nr:hypothetical protein C8Q74DRAFT_1448763 [Fomes fomentarius]